MTRAYPHRLRLHGGRNKHAAKLAAGFPENLITACGYIEGNGDHRQPDNTIITCRGCIRVIGRENR